MFHRNADSAVHGDQGYDGSFTFTHALAPILWLAVVGACMLGALGAVGYLSPDVDLHTGKEATHLLQKFADALPVEPNVARNRAALAFSGVTLAITAVLAFTCVFWAGAAFRRKDNSYRLVVLFWTAAFFLLCVLILWWMRAKGYQPFASAIADKLLNWNRQPEGSRLDLRVTEVMFALACVLPGVLSAGACFLLQPVRRSSNSRVMKTHRELLRDRLKELDQLLYIGALTLVFGTLQLSTAISVPLASMPNATDLKIEADLCKSLSPVTPASSPFYSQGLSDPKTSFYEGFGVEQCRKLPRSFAQASAAEDLRQLARGVTLSFGLAFSALLAAIYVPALIGIGILIAPLQPTASKKVQGSDSKNADSPEVDPLRRIAAIIATLSPLLAGLLANTFATG